MRGYWIRISRLAASRLAALLALSLIAVLILCSGCEQRPSPRGDSEPAAAGKTDTTGKSAGDVDTAGWSPELRGGYLIDTYDNYIEKGDLDAIKRRGKLRILVDVATTSILPRAATQQDIEINQLKRFARKLGVEPVILYTFGFDTLIPLLNAGKGDIIANDITITDARKKLVDFSIPTVHTKLVLVSQQDVAQVGEGDKLKGKTLTVSRGTTYETLGREFARQHPGVKLVVTDRNYVDVAVDVAMGHTDFTIIDEAILDLVLQFRDDLKKNLVFPGEQVLAWPIRKNSPQLLATINDKIRHIKLSRTTGRFTGDLADIKQRGVLRAVTRNNAGTYFLWKGRILGYEYELLKDFADNLGVRLEIIVAPEHSTFISMLHDGKADIAANLFAVTPRREQQGIKFSDMTHKARVVVVSRPGKEVKKLSDLSGRTVYVRKSSSHYDLVQKIHQQVPGLKVELVPETMDIQDIFDKIADGEYDLTFADDITVNSERSWRTDIMLSLDLHDDHAHAWMMRDSNPELVTAVDQFLKKPKTRKKLQQLYKKYFDSPKPPRPEITKLSREGKISPYDHLAKQYAEQYDFDWRLIIAQMFQESSFNPKAKSWVGARGLMQVMPDTGKQVGESNLFDPETSVRAGVKYLEWLYRKFDDKGIGPDNQMWFTLASYNAGLGHVYDAQLLAEEKGWDPRVWFGNVEKAMLLLSDKKYYRKARYGYARGREPFDYVRKIEARFRTYVALLNAYQRQRHAAIPQPLPPIASAPVAASWQPRRQYDLTSE